MITDGKLQLASNSLYGGTTVDSGAASVLVVPQAGNAYATTINQIGSAVDIGVVRDLGVGEVMLVGIRLKTLPSGGTYPATFSFAAYLSNAHTDTAALTNKAIASSHLLARDASSGTFDELLGIKVQAGDWVFIAIPPLDLVYNAETSGLRYLRVVQHMFWNGLINGAGTPDDTSGTCEIYLGPASEFLTLPHSKTYPSGAIN